MVQINWRTDKPYKSLHSLQWLLSHAIIENMSCDFLLKHFDFQRKLSSFQCCSCKLIEIQSGAWFCLFHEVIKGYMNAQNWLQFHLKYHFVVALCVFTHLMLCLVRFTKRMQMGYSIFCSTVFYFVKISVWE